MSSKITQSKSRPIIFSAEMVNAILDGRKTQTRRVIKGHLPEYPIREGGKNWGRCFYGTRKDGHYYCSIKCPFGKIGGKLYVKEDFAEGWAIGGYAGHVNPDEDPGGETIDIIYKARYNDKHFNDWKSGYFMKQEQSRITLEITNIRVERLQDISEEDAFSEGINPEEDENYMKAEHYQLGGSPDIPAIHAFACLWQSIKGKDSWDENPFVWILEFKKEVADEK